MSNQLIEAMNDAELEREQVLIQEIKRGMDEGKRVILVALREVHESRLYRSEGTLRQWVAKNFGFTERHLNYYLHWGEVQDNLIEASAKNAEKLSIRASISLHPLESDAQVETWNKASEIAKDRGKNKVTERIIKEVIRESNPELKPISQYEATLNVDVLFGAMRSAFFDLDEQSRFQIILELSKELTPEYLGALHAAIE